MSFLPTSLFSNGALVEVAPEQRRGRPNSEGGLGFVVGFDTNAMTVNILYALGGLSQEIPSTRVKPATLDTTARRRPRQISTQPSLLSINHHSSNQQPANMTGCSTHTQLKGAAKYVQESASWLPNGRKKHLVLWFLRKGKKEKGWLRNLEAKIENCEPPRKKQQLNTKERATLTQLFAIVKNVPVSNYPAGCSPVADLAYAWGIGRTTVTDIFKTVTDCHNDAKRKKRSDAGLTVFNSDKRRGSTYTPFDSFKRFEHAKRPGEIITNNELKEEQWIGLDNNQQKKFQHATEDLQLHRSPQLTEEIKRILQISNGYIPWRAMATKLASTMHYTKNTIT